MSYFKQAVEMMCIDNQVNISAVEHLTNKLKCKKVETECERAAMTISLEQRNEFMVMSDLFMMVHGDEFDINTLSARYPILSKKLDELWDLIDSDYIDNLEEKNNVPQSK